MRTLGRRLRAEGYEPHTLTLRPRRATVDLHAYARQVAAYADAHLGPDVAPDGFGLVAHSMGGIVARVYLQRLGGLDRVHRLVTLSSPHKGSAWAHPTPLPAARDLRPGSELLADLDRDAHRLEAVRPVSIWTPFDLMIVPASSSVASFGTVEQIPVLHHRLMLFSPRVARRVAHLLRQTARPGLAAA